MPERFQIGEYWLSQWPGRPGWCVTWYDKRARQTRRKTLNTSDEEAAKLKLAEWCAQHGELKQAPAQQILLDVILARYYDNHARNLASAQQAYYAIQRLSDALPGYTIAEFNHEAQTKLIASMRAEGLSDSYISRTLTVARAALNYAYKRDQIDRMPFVMTAGESPARERILSDNEMTALLQAIDSPVLARFFLWSLNTTARPAAILELQHFQIDLRARLVRLNPPGRRQTKKHRPTVPLTATLQANYDRSNGSEYVIGKRLKSIRTQFRTIVKAAGLDGTGVTPYTLRHTMGTQLRARGVPPWEAAGIMGHKIGGTTEIYAKYAPDYLGSAASAIDAYMKEMLKSVEWANDGNSLPSRHGRQHP